MARPHKDANTACQNYRLSSIESSDNVLTRKSSDLILGYHQAETKAPKYGSHMVNDTERMEHGMGRLVRDATFATLLYNHDFTT